MIIIIIIIIIVIVGLAGPTQAGRRARREPEGRWPSAAQQLSA